MFINRHKWRIALIVCVLYVLSIGPAVVLVQGQYVQPRTLEIVYSPLHVLPWPCDHVIRRYMELWK